MDKILTAPPCKHSKVLEWFTEVVVALGARTADSSTETAANLIGRWSSPRVIRVRFLLEAEQLLHDPIAMHHVFWYSLFPSVLVD